MTLPFENDNMKITKKLAKNSVNAPYPVPFLSFEKLR